MIVHVDVLGNISPNDQTNPWNPVLQNFPTDMLAYVFASVFLYSVSDKDQQISSTTIILFKTRIWYRLLHFPPLQTPISFNLLRGSNDIYMCVCVWWKF